MPLPFEVEVRAQLSAGWTDITSRVRVTDPITITRGMRDETTKSTPATCMLTFDDPNGEMNPVNPISPFYGKFGRNTPVEVLVRQAFDSFTSTRVNSWEHGAADEGGLQWPDLSRNGGGGSLLASDWQVNGGFGKMTCPVTNSWRKSLTATTDMYLDVDVETEFSLPVMPSGGNVCPSIIILRAQTGTGAEYYVRPEITPGGAMTFTLRDNTGTVYATAFGPLGALVTAGALVKMRGQIEGQTLRGKIWLSSNPEPVDWTLTAHVEYIDVPGRVGVWNWAMTNTNVPYEFRTNSFKIRHQRFVGELAEYETGSDDGGGKVRWTKVTAAGITRRLGQGDPPVQSPMYRASTRLSSVVGYWPCEDGPQARTPAAVASTGAGSAAAAQAMIIPFSFTREVPPAKMAAMTSFRGSKPLPDMDVGGWMALPTPATPTTALEVQFAANMVPSAVVAPNTSSGLFTLGMTGDLSVILCNWYPSGAVGLFWIRVNPNGSFRDSGTVGPITFATAGRNMLYRLVLTQSGANINYSLEVHGERDDTGGVASGFNSGTLVTGSQLGAANALVVNSVATVQADGMAKCGIGHILIRAATNANTIPYFSFDDPFSGHHFESAVDRMIRVATEQGFGVSYVGKSGGGPTASSVLLGPQKIENPLKVLQEAADTDMGLLYEPKGALGVEYRTAASVCTGTAPALCTLDLASGHMTSAFRPVLDDQNTVNRVTAKRPLGGEATVSKLTGPMSVLAPPLGIGAYDQSIDSNTAIETATGVVEWLHKNTLASRAGWALNLGTAADPRFPECVIHLGTLAATHRRQVLDLGPGCRVDITGASSLGVYGTQRQVVRGYSEVITNHTWQIRLITAPWSPYDVAKLDTTGALRLLPSVDAVLASSYNSSATSWSVTTNAADTWITTATHPSLFPLTMMVAGEQVSVTAIVGAGTSKTFTVVRSQNGVQKAQDAGTALTIKSPIKLALS